MNWFKSIKADMPSFDAYHGTPSAPAVEKDGFDYAFLGKGNEAYGPGFYFTDSEKVAQQYAGNDPSSGVLRARVNLNNPIVISGTGRSISDQFPPLSYQQISKMIHRSIELFGDERLHNWGDPDFEGADNIIRKIIESHVNAPFTHLLYDFFQEDIEQGLRVIQGEAGYDGVIVNFDDGNRFIVAWFTEQIQIQPRNVSRENI